MYIHISGMVNILETGCYIQRHNFLYQPGKCPEGVGTAEDGFWNWGVLGKLMDNKYNILLL
jgi:hypothetical protein